MNATAAAKHLLGIGLCSAFVLALMMGAFMVALSTWEDGPPRDPPFSPAHLAAAEQGYKVFSVFSWPGLQVSQSGYGLALSSVLYGGALYGVLLALRRTLVHRRAKLLSSRRRS